MYVRKQKKKRLHPVPFTTEGMAKLIYFVNFQKFVSDGEQLLMGWNNGTLSADVF